jgi:hypothetical protein
MRLIRILYLLTCIMVAQAQQTSSDKFFPVLQTKVGDSIKPLELWRIEPSHFWIEVKFPENLPENELLVNGKSSRSPVNATLGFLMIQPEYIEPMYSEDNATLARFRGIYSKGLEEFLGKKRTFQITVTSQYPGLGQRACVFSFGEQPQQTLQYQMIRSGYAVIKGSDPTPISATVMGGGKSFALTIHPKPGPPSEVKVFGKAFLDLLLARLSLLATIFSDFRALSARRPA